MTTTTTLRLPPEDVEALERAERAMAEAYGFGETDEGTPPVATRPWRLTGAAAPGRTGWAHPAGAMGKSEDVVALQRMHAAEEDDAEAALDASPDEIARCGEDDDPDKRRGLLVDESSLRLRLSSDLIIATDASRERLLEAADILVRSALPQSTRETLWRLYRAGDDALGDLAETYA
jgi:hypothetical protein